MRGADVGGLESADAERMVALRDVLQHEAKVICAELARIGDLNIAFDDLVARDLGRVKVNAEEMGRRAGDELSPACFESRESPFEHQFQVVRHDMRGLLNNILGRAQLLELDNALPSEVLEHVSKIGEASRRCVEALDCSRQESADEVGGTVASGEMLLPLLESASPAENTRQAPGTILVVDDTADSREQMERFLERTGHTVRTAADGMSALEFLDANDVDLILLDLHMPGMNGFQVLDRLRERGILAHTPVIIVSGMDFETHAVRGIEMGAQDYVSRPVNFGLLKARVNSVLERQRLRERELGQFFTASLARELVRRPELLQVGRNVEVSVLFLDVVGFSSVSEKLGPIKTIEWLGHAMEVFSECIHEHHGVLVDYTGDQIMAIWGAPQDDLEHATHACEAALALIGCLPEIDARWLQILGHPTTITIGVNTGEAFVGNVGTRQKFKYGALGNTVNLASRLQSATKYVRAPVIVSGDTHSMLSRKLLSRRLTKLKVNNIAQPVDVHELSPPDRPGPQTLYPEYEQALALYEAGEFHQAGALLGDILKRHTDDGPTLLLLSRTVNAIVNRGEEHDPVWVLPGK